MVEEALVRGKFSTFDQGERLKNFAEIQSRMAFMF